MNKTLRLTRAVYGGFLLLVLYIGFYLANPMAPGNSFDPCCIRGWIGWGDQGFYYKSAAALAAGNLNPDFHWYPLGYAILAAPFEFLGNHPFFPVDAICLIAVYTAIILFARRVGISPTVAAIIVLLTLCADRFMFEQWAIPWTTTPAAALIWGLLAASAAHLQGQRQPFLIGLFAAALPLTRPTDGIVSAVCVAWVGMAELRAARLKWRDLAWLAVGVALPILPYAALHLAIYGPNATQYMLNSRGVGFTAHNPIWRAYVLLIEPRQWFFTGEGLIPRMPWLLLGGAGALWAFWRGGAAALLSACLIVYCALYLCYTDLLPTNLWYYMYVHYFKWTLPGFGLLAWLLLKELRLRQPVAWSALAFVLLLSCIHVAPRPAAANEDATVVDIPGPVSTETNSTMTTQLMVTDSRGALTNILSMRAIPFPYGNGVRLFGIKRDFSSSVDWVPGHGLDMPADAPPQRRWAEQISIGYPCWLPPHKCKKPTNVP